MTINKTFIAKKSEIPNNRYKLVTIGKNEVAIFNCDGKFYAIKDACPHQSQSLSRGTLMGTVISCPGHNWQFDISTGKCIKGNTELSLKTYEVLMENDNIYIVA